MERFFKGISFKGILRDFKGFLGILRDNSFSGRTLVRRYYRPFKSLNISSNPLIFLPILSLILLLLPSCNVGADIGGIFGRWQIKTIQTPDSIATPNDLFFDFQGKVHLAHVLSEEDHLTLVLHGITRHEGDSLYITYMPMDGIGDTMREYLTRRFLIEDDYEDVRFRILQVDGSRMILTRGNRRWELRAY